MQKSDEARFFGKNPILPKFGHLGPKMAQNEVFGVFKKIESLVLAGNEGH